LNKKLILNEISLNNHSFKKKEILSAVSERDGLSLARLPVSGRKYLIQERGNTRSGRMEPCLKMLLEQ